MGNQHLERREEETAQLKAALGVPQDEPETPPEPPDEPDGTPTPGEGDEPPEEPAEPQSTGLPQPKSEKEIEKGLQALEKEAQRHAKRIGEIMEEDAQHLLGCELCAPLIPGFRWSQVPEDQRAAVMLAIGFEPTPDYEEDSQSHACPDCKGWGYVKTGSKVKGQDALTCTSCKGKGWRGPREQQAPQVPMMAQAPGAESGLAIETPLDPDREDARAAAQAAGFMVIDTRAPAVP